MCVCGWLAGCQALSAAVLFVYVSSNYLMQRLVTLFSFFAAAATVINRGVFEAPLNACVCVVMLFISTFSARISYLLKAAEPLGPEKNLTFM